MNEWLVLEQEAYEYDKRLCEIKRKLIYSFGISLTYTIINFLEDFESNWRGFNSIDLKESITMK